VGVDRLRRCWLGQFRPGRNALGLRAEILIADHHARPNRGPEDFWRILGTLLHELLHAWQELHGKPGKRNYHNREFRRKAVELGLVIDQRGVTEYDPGSPFFGVFDREFIVIPDLPVPKLYKPQPKRAKLALWTCGCNPPQRARIGKSEFEAMCPRCNNFFRPA